MPLFNLDDGQSKIKKKKEVLLEEIYSCHSRIRTVERQRVYDLWERWESPMSS